MNGRTLISTGLVVVAACCCCFAVSHAQPAPSAADGLTARLSLHRDRVLLGEPLRIRVSLVNRGATDIVTAPKFDDSQIATIRSKGVQKAIEVP